MLSKIVLAPALLTALPAAAQTYVSPAPATPGSTSTSTSPTTVVTTPSAQKLTVIQQQAFGDVLRAGAPVPVALSQALTTKGKSLKVGNLCSWKLLRT
jgi:hypothetical protein